MPSPVNATCWISCGRVGHRGAIPLSFAASRQAIALTHKIYPFWIEAIKKPPAPCIVAKEQEVVSIR